MIDEHQQSLAALAGAFAGFILGIHMAVAMALQHIPRLPGATPPEWVAGAERLWLVAAVGLAAAAMAWMYVDYRYEVAR